MDLTWCGCRPHWLLHRTDVVSRPPLPPPLRLVLSPSLFSSGFVCLSPAPSSSQGTHGASPQSSWPGTNGETWTADINIATNSLMWNANRRVLSVPLAAGQRLHVEVREQAGNVTGALLLYNKCRDARKLRDRLLQKHSSLESNNHEPQKTHRCLLIWCSPLFQPAWVNQRERNTVRKKLSGKSAKPDDI